MDAGRAWKAVRELDLAQSAVVRTLFGIRTIPDRLKGKTGAASSSPGRPDLDAGQPGFQVSPKTPRTKWLPARSAKSGARSFRSCTFRDAAGLPAFSRSGLRQGRLGAARRSPESERTSRVEFEVRVAATDDDAWKKFIRYFRLIGPGSHFIRRVLLAQLERDLGTPESVQNERALPGDELIPDAVGQFTHSIVIAAPPENIWPWLVQMGCQRAGFYSLDLLDNAGVPSAREIRLELQQLRVGDRIPATPEGDAHFEVLRMEQNRALLFGGLFDVENQRQLPFDAARPRRFWQVTWAFVLEPLDRGRTRLYARARGAFSPSERFHAFWIRPVHHLMQTAQLRHLAERVEGRPSSDGMRDVLESVGDAIVSAMPGRHG